jgi:hypothetical protein
MEESCFCGQTDELEDREPILDDDDRWALRCRATGAGRLLSALRPTKEQESKGE